MWLKVPCVQSPVLREREREKRGRREGGREEGEKETSNFALLDIF
jgi:hypothetical protein